MMRASRRRRARRRAPSSPRSAICGASRSAKSPGISEAVEWAEAATLLDKGGARWPDAFRRSIGVALKDEEDLGLRGARTRRASRRGGGMSALPPPRALLVFRRAAARNGFAVAPEQTTAFLVGDPLSARAIPTTSAAPAHRDTGPAARAARRISTRCFASFLGEGPWHRRRKPSDEESLRVQDERRGEDEPISGEDNESGQAATRAREAFGRAPLRAGSEDETLRRLARDAPARCRGGAATDGAPRAAARAPMRGGCFARPCAMPAKSSSMRRAERRLRQRRIVLLIDVSGSMKERTEDDLRLRPRAASSAADAVEVFTFGTRLTRITRPMRLKRREQALAAASLLVRDWDGGTRIGDALGAFLAVPRFASLARGAAVAGRCRTASSAATRAPCAMRSTSCRGAPGALSWLTPLAADAGFRAAHRGLVAIAPFLDELGNGGSIASISPTFSIWRREGGVSADHRRPSPHLAAGRSALARWADAAAHLRPLRADPARLSDQRISCRHRRLRRRQVGLCAGQLGQGALSRTRSPGCSATADETGWPHAIVGYADFMRRRRAPAARPAGAISLLRGVRMQLHWHENPQYRFAARPDLARDPDVADERRPSRRLRLELRPAGVCAARWPARPNLPTACPKVTFVLQHAGMLEDLSPAGRAAMARRHGAARGAPERRLPSFPALGTFIHRNDPAHIADVVRETVGMFGPERCLFGSNFPIEKLWTRYADLVAAYRRRDRAVRPKEQQAIAARHGDAGFIGSIRT